ncbi:hypothetical protein CBM2599_B50300 [Cupriavidus taiwanensis]|nr:hypothetical protein CBM2599_B50300 [Cupriavidus taiwanensis]
MRRALRREQVDQTKAASLFLHLSLELKSVILKRTRRINRVPFTANLVLQASAFR